MTHSSDPFEIRGEPYVVSPETIAEARREEARMSSERQKRYAEPVREIRGRRILTCGGVTLHGVALVSDRNGPFTLAFLADGHADPFFVDTRVWRVSFEPSGWSDSSPGVAKPSAPGPPAVPPMAHRTWTPDLS